MDQRAKFDEGGAEQARMFLARWLFSPLDGVLLEDWLPLLWKRGAAIPPAYWARAGFVTGMSALNSALRPLENRRFAPRLRELRVERPVFVLGHHRSGTTHLWNLLTQDERFAYPTILQAVFPHSFLSLEGLTRTLAQRLAIRKRPQDNVEIHPDGPVEEERALCAATFLSIQMARHFPRHRDAYGRYLTMREVDEDEKVRWKAAFEAFSKKVLLRHGVDKTLVFKSPDHTAKVRLILELFPDARFVHIHRHPYTVYASTLKMERTTQPIYALQRAEPEDQEAFIRWRYRAMYDAFFEDQALIPDGQFSEVSFTDLESRPLEVMERIYRELDLPDFTRAEPALTSYLSTIAGYRKNRHPNLPPEVRTRLQADWAPCFERWGYDP
jgi:hypothetical protein